jgi:hypothetical protein
VVIGSADLEACFKNNPFLKEKEIDTKKIVCGIYFYYPSKYQYE